MIKLRKRDFPQFIMASANNALEFIEEAISIYYKMPQVRNTTVFLLMSLGLEEFGKAFYARVVLGMALEEGWFNNKNYVTLDGAFNHKQKQIFAFLGLAKENLKLNFPFSEFQRFFKEVADTNSQCITYPKNKNLWNKRNRCIYVDCINSKIIKPESLNEVEVVKWLKFSLEFLVRIHETFPNLSQNEERSKFNANVFRNKWRDRIEIGMRKRMKAGAIS